MRVEPMSSKKKKGPEPEYPSFRVSVDLALQVRQILRLDDFLDPEDEVLEEGRAAGLSLEEIVTMVVQDNYGDVGGHPTRLLYWLDDWGFLNAAACEITLDIEQID